MNYLTTLREYFREQRLSQNEIADKLGVSSAFVSGVLTGKFPIGKKTAQRFTDAYGISTVWLLSKGEVGSMFGESTDNSVDLTERIKFLEEQVEFYKKQNELLQEIIKKNISEK